MNKNTIVDIANSILGLSREKKKELINLLVELYNRKEFQNVEQKINDNLQASKDYADGKIQEAINNLIDGAPEAYDTLKEIATALGDEGVVGQLLQTINQKLDASDYIQTDWEEEDDTKKDFIKNKPFYENIIFNKLGTIVYVPQTYYLTLTKDEHDENYLKVDFFFKSTNENEPSVSYLKIQKDQQIVFNNETYYKIDEVIHASNSGGDGRHYGLLYKQENDSIILYKLAYNSTIESIISTYSFVNNVATIDSIVGGGSVYYMYNVYRKTITSRKLDRKYLPYEGSDWNEEDTTKLEHIKNRPIYDYNTENQQTKVINVVNNEFPNIQQDTIKALYAKRINVVDGTHFDLEFYIGAANSVFDENTFEKINNLVGYVDGTTDFISGSYGKHYVIFNKNKPSEKLEIIWYNGRFDARKFGLIFKDSNETGYFSIDSIGDIDTRLRQVDSLGDIFKINVSLSGNTVEFAAVSLIYTEIVRHLKQLDTKYIPNSIIQRIEALESIVQQLQGYHQE